MELALAPERGKNQENFRETELQPDPIIPDIFSGIFEG